MKHPVKKVLCLLAALLLICAGAAAHAGGGDTASPAVSSFAGCGVAFVLPEGMRNLSGTVYAYDATVLEGIGCVDVLYSALPEKRFAELYQKVIVDQVGTKAEIAAYFDATASVCAVYCVGDGGDFNTVAEAYRARFHSDDVFADASAVKLAQVGDYGFYLRKIHDTARGTSLEGGDSAAEYERVLSSVDAMIDGMAFTKPDAARSEKYAPAMKLLQDLNGEAPAPAADSPATANGLNAFRVHVTDGSAPVEGVTVQFCSDTACILGKTDGDGYATFDQPEGAVYTVHILKVPKGYEKNKNEYATLDVWCDLEVVIDRAAEG